MNTDERGQLPANTDCAVSQAGHLRRAGALPWWAVAAYRVVLWCSLRYALPRMYGGGVLNARGCRAFWIGRNAPRDVCIGGSLDAWYAGVGRQFRSDFGIPQERLPRLYVVVLSDPPGLPEVAQRVGLDARYSVESGTRSFYFRHERAVFITWEGTMERLRQSLVYLACQALFHTDCGVSRAHMWAVHGYACLAVVRQCAPHALLSGPRLRHFLGCLETGRAMHLEQILTTDYAEPYYGPRAYNEQLYHLFLWLHDRQHEVPQVWQSLRDCMATRQTAEGEFINRLERELRMPVAVIEKEFVAWCRQQLARLPAMEE